MSKQLTLTVPDIVNEAMAAKGAPFDLSAGEWLKSQVMASAFGADIVLRLGQAVEAARLKPGAVMVTEGELPLGGVKTEG